MVVMTNKKCFIIMPVSTPPELVSEYNDDSEHFLNVMEQLFIPAIKEAGFEPIRPITKGSDIIHGHIISNLESSDLVLCDMSTKNPNVFFEFGIRTALNKPICLVKDNLLKKVPFDTASNNYHEYSSDIRKWIFERERLVKHIKDSFSESDNCNSLWKYFGNKTQSKEAIYQSKETIEQSKKEQQIRDIENRLEKFYIPADEIINGQLKKNHEQTINGGPNGSGVLGLKHIRKYSYLADTKTYKTYETYIKTNCQSLKPIACKDMYRDLKDYKCTKENRDCRDNWKTCDENLEKCMHFSECPTKDQDNIIINNLECKYYLELKDGIAADIEFYTKELYRLKNS
jgi:hypothetical protein